MSAVGGGGARTPVSAKVDASMVVEGGEEEEARGAYPRTASRLLWRFLRLRTGSIRHHRRR